VVRTRVGYTGGTKKNPTYHAIGDHSETLQIDFDPKQISYAELVDIFWRTHNPCEQGGSRQYRSALFYHNEEQKRLALATRDREAARHGAPIATPILPASDFYIAEDYHQKHALRRDAALMREFRNMYPSDEDFVRSTAAARVNGYLAGCGSRDSLEKEIDGLGLSEQGKNALIQSVRGSR
jgi:methionine-S-sulfoxide reductase